MKYSHDGIIFIKKVVVAMVIFITTAACVQRWVLLIFE